MRSLTIATSARRAGAPVPSTTSPFLMTRSYCGGAHAAADTTRSAAMVKRMPGFYSAPRPLFLRAGRRHAVQALKVVRERRRDAGAAVCQPDDVDAVEVRGRPRGD